MCARELARSKVKVLVIESNNYLGGGFWIGGYLMNKTTFRAPSQEVLDELGIPYKEVERGLFVADAPHACAKLITAACQAGAKVLSMTKIDDVVYKDDRVNGVVINWTPVGALPRAITCVDPVSLEAKVVVDATGHDANVVKALEEREIIEAQGCGPMDVASSEDLVVEKTGIIHPGLVICGMSVSTVYGIPRMGPTFGAMLLSGMKAAEACKEILHLNHAKV
jgi:thiamine thiazole synthase